MTKKFYVNLMLCSMQSVILSRVQQAPRLSGWKLVFAGCRHCSAFALGCPPAALGIWHISEISSTKEFRKL